MVQKAMDALNMWSPNLQEEIELEINLELWCRLGRLALNFGTPVQTRQALYCAENALTQGDEKAKKKEYMSIPVTRLRWYSVAQSLYGECLYKLLDS